MARLTADPQPVQAPDMFGYSKTPSRFEVQENNYLGKLFGNLGEDVDAGAKGAYTAIDMSLKKDARTALDPILDAGTSGLDENDIRAVAGTGARGSKYQSASIDTATDAFGNQTDNALPPDAQARLDGAKRLYQSYRQGNLSDSMIDMKIASVAKNLKQQYPGFEEEVDKGISEIRGTSSANKLRESALRDLNAMSASQQSAQNKLLTEYDKDAPYLPAGTSFQEYAVNPLKYKTDAQTWRANEETIKQNNLQIENDAKKGVARGDFAERSFIAAANNYVSRSFNDALEKAQLDFVSLSQDGANANPKAVEDNKNHILQLRQQAELNLRKMSSGPLNDDPSVSYNSVIKDTGKTEAAIKQALSPFDAVLAAYGGDKPGIAASAANIGKMQTSQDYLKFTQTFPAARALKSIEQSAGPQAAAVAMSGNPALVEPLSKAVADTAWFNIKYKGDGAPPPAASDVVTAVSSATTRNPGAAARATVQAIQHGAAASSDPEEASRFVQSLYGDDKFFDKLKPSEQRRDFQMLVHPAFTAKMVELRKASPEAFGTYAGSVEKMAPVVYRQEMADLQAGHDFNKYNVAFDPKTLHFNAETLPQFKMEPGRFTGQMADPATASVAGVNRLADSLRPVLEAKYGDQAPAAFMNVLKQAGFNPDAPKNHPLTIDVLGGKVADWIKSQLPDNPAMKEEMDRATPGKRSDASTSGKLSMEDSLPPADGTGRWKYAYDALTSKYGYKPEIAAGIMGSLAGETSDLNPNAVHDKGIGLGIAGWNKDRLAGLKQFAASKNLNYHDTDAQIAFVDHELHTTEKSTLAALDRARTPDEAAAIFTHLYERPSVPNTRARMGHALGFYRAFNKAG